MKMKTIQRNNIWGIQIDKMSLCCTPINNELYGYILNSNDKTIKLNSDIYIKHGSNSEIWLVFVENKKYGYLSLEYGKYFLTIENSILYDVQIQEILPFIISSLGAQYNNITEIHLCKDVKKSPITIIDKLRKENVDVIFNNRLLNKDIYENKIFEIRSGTFAQPNKNRSLYFKLNEKKYFRIYNKKAELQNNEKEYQNTDDKKIYRIELVLKNTELRKLHQYSNFEIFEYYLFDFEFLNEIFYKGCNQIIHFRSGKELLKWEDILQLK